MTCKIGCISRPNLSAAAVGLALLTTCALAQAHAFCVSTAQDLQDALTQSSDLGTYAGLFNEIKILPGLYKTGAATGNGPFTYTSTASGGGIAIESWSTCTEQSYNPTLSVLDGNGATQVLHIVSFYGPVTVQNLTIQNGETSDVGAGLAVNTNVGGAPPSQIFIINNIIRNNHTSDLGGGVVAISGDTPLGISIELKSNLIVGNSADGGDSAGYLLGYDTIDVFNNTVTRNTTTTSGNWGGLHITGGPPTNVWNNIFLENTKFGVYLEEGANIYFQFNDYGTLGGEAPAHSVGSLSVVAKFVDAAGGNFHLAGDSPLLGLSTFLTESLDLDGNPTPTSGVMDLGAYEETVFSSGFDR